MNGEHMSLGYVLSSLWDLIAVTLCDLLVMSMSEQTRMTIRKQLAAPSTDEPPARTGTRP